jgi:hypothetical protein
VYAQVFLAMEDLGKDDEEVSDDRHEIVLAYLLIRTRQLNRSMFKQNVF